ncbi:MAG: aldehyde dehydrogenase family protein [Armatimonadaceae bacterium]
MPTSPAKMRAVHSPYDHRVVGEVPVHDLSYAERAVATAHHAFSHTRRLPAHERYRILRAIESGIAARREEFANLICAEGGKPIKHARVEVDRAILVFSLAAEEARRLDGELLPLDLNKASENRLGLVRRVPAGPVGALTPFNFPLNLAAHKVGPALAVGNPVVLKPAEKTPLTAKLLTEVVYESGFPEEAFHLLTPEDPREIGTLLATDDRIRVLSFTGSDRVGWELKAKANRKRVTLELGGNAAVLIEPDAAIETVAGKCAVGAFAHAGQVCISVQRIFVHREVFDRFTEAFLAAARALQVGDPADDATDIGPMITADACEKALSWIAAAQEGGAKTLLSGERLAPNLLSPTVLTHTRPEMKVCTEEAFAPLAVVEPYADWHEALQAVNNSRYGLQAGVFTNNIQRIFEAFDTLQVGGVIANDVPQYRVDHMPYGGEKDSGFGREGIRYAIEEMTERRLLALNLS